VACAQEISCLPTDEYCLAGCGHENAMWEMLLNAVGAVLAVVYIALRRAKAGS
jgi:hypothetical protein